MRTTTTLAALTLIAVAGTPAMAMDLFDFSDLRVGASTVGSSLTATVNGAEEKDKWKNAERYSLDWVAGTSVLVVGVAYGAGITVDRRSTDGGDADMQSYVGRLQAGPYLNLGPLSIELLGFYGRTVSKLDTNNGDDRTYGKEYGANLNAVFSIAHLVVGATVGLLKQDADFDLNSSEVSVKSADYTAGLFAGFRF